MAITAKKRIWGWMSFDWAAQPFYTLGLTFIFGPYFAVVRSAKHLGLWPNDCGPGYCLYRTLPWSVCR